MAKIIKVVYDVNDTELLKAKKEIQNIEKETKDSESAFKQMGNAGSKAFGVISGIAATLGLAAIGKQIIDITAEFQKLSAVLTNTLGSRSAAQQALNTIKQFAAQTPFSVVELTDSFVKLANQGFKPTIEQLRNLGDLASSQGKSFNQLTEAIIDAQTGEFERLKEFGIRAAKEGDRVTFTFKGVEKQTKFTSEAVREYILSLGEAKGVSGSMAAISETLGGRISNLGDSWDSLLNTIGDGNKGIVADTISLLGSLITKVNELIKTSEQLSQEYRQGVVQTQLDAAKEFAKGFKDQSTALNSFADNLERKAEKINQAYGEIVQQQIDRAPSQYELFVGLSQAREIELKQLESKRQALGDEYAAYIDSANAIREYIKLVNKPNPTTEQLGLIESLEKKLKELRESRDKAFSVSEINRFNQAIKETEKQLKKLIGGEGTGFKDIKPDDTASKIEKAFDQAWDATTGKQKKSLDILNAGLEDHVEKFKKAEEAKKEAAKKAADEREEYEKRKQEAIVNTAIDAAQQILYATLLTREEDFSSREAYYQKEIELAGDNDNAKRNLEQRREIEEKQFRDRQLAAEKSNSIKKILIDTAANVVRSIYNNGGIPLGLPFGYLAAALGAVQVATVRKYKDGEVNIDGPGTSTSDSISARLSKGESVINAKATAASRNLLEAINDRKIDDRILQVAASNGGRQVSVFDDSKIIRELRENRVQFENHGYTLMKHAKTASNFKSIMRSKIQGYS